MSISNPDVGGTRAYVHIGRVTCHICFRTFTKASAEKLGLGSWAMACKYSQGQE
jgi:hypothetical protein